MPIFSLWSSQLQPASFNGIPFVVENDAVSSGRRHVLHEFPYRDNPILEDLGKATRRLSFSGFLVGDDVFFQRDALQRACERSGAGTLVHPSIGVMRAYLTNVSFSTQAERGRTIALQMDFIVADARIRLWPTASVDTQGASDIAATNMDAAASSDFFSQVGATLQQGEVAVNRVLGTVSQYTSLAQHVLGDAAHIFGAVRGLGSIVGVSHSLGRYAGGNLLSVSSALSTVNRGIGLVYSVEAGANALLFDAASARNLVGSTANAVMSLGSAL